MAEGRFQLALSGTTAMLLDSQNGNVYIPIQVKEDAPMIWKLHVKGDVQRRDRVARPLRTLPIDETP